MGHGGVHVVKLFITTKATTRATPHPFLIAASCYRLDGLCIQDLRFLIRPDGWEIPAALAEETGITTRDAAMCGVAIATAMRSVKALTEIASEWFAFDEGFTSASLAQGMLDAGSQTAWQARPIRGHCAMRAAQAVCGLKDDAGLDRAPKLAEAAMALAHFKPAAGLGDEHLALREIVEALTPKGAFQ